MVHEAVRLSDEPLAVDQVEYHPLLAQDRLLDALRGHGMGLTAYSPLAQGEVFGDDTLSDIGEDHGKTAGQVALRWLIQQDGVSAIPRSSSVEHAESNFEIFDFELSQDEMRKIHQLSAGRRRLVDPADSPDWD
jgi:diketogulonate reductase-like aldo/keto reductase